MSSAEIASTMEVSSRFRLIESAMARRMPVTTRSSPCSPAPSSRWATGVVGVAVCSVALPGEPGTGAAASCAVAGSASAVDAIKADNSVATPRISFPAMFFLPRNGRFPPAPCP